MALLSKYKDIFGAPNTGAHSYRLFDIAIIDLVLSLFVAYVITLITYLIKKRNQKKNIDNKSVEKEMDCFTKCKQLDSGISFYKSLIINTVYILLIGIFAHALFGVNTKLNTILFGKLL